MELRSTFHRMTRSSLPERPSNEPRYRQMQAVLTVDIPPRASHRTVGRLFGPSDMGSTLLDVFQMSAFAVGFHHSRHSCCREPRLRRVNRHSVGQRSFNHSKKNRESFCISADASRFLAELHLRFPSRALRTAIRVWRNPQVRSTYPEPIPGRAVVVLVQLS